VVGPDGAVLFTGADIAAGQQVFLRYGLMGSRRRSGMNAG
jgi:nitric oxide reductase subunit B